MKHLQSLLEQAAAALDAESRAALIVFGSAPLVLAGLKPEVVNDLDFFASEATFERLHRGGLSLDASRPGMPVLRVGPSIEVFKTWPGVTFEDVASSAVVARGSHGFRVANLSHVLAYKLATNREKDQPDIALLRRALGE